MSEVYSERLMHFSWRTFTLRIYSQPPHRDIHKTALGATETVAGNILITPEQSVSLKEGI